VQETNKDAPKTPAPPAAQSMPYGQRTAGVPPELLGLHQQYVNQMMNYMSEWSQGRYNSVDWNNLQHLNPIYYPNSQNTTQNASVDSPGATSSGTPTPDRGNTGESTQDIPNANTAEVARLAETARVEENARVAVEAARAAAEAARVANAARVAAARDDDDPPRDIIDWMYTLSRVALIFSVVYFYSNFTRFFLVVILSALVFILQRRPFLWNGRQPAVQEAPAAAPRPIANPAPEPEPPREGEPQPEPEVHANGVNAVAGEGANPPEAQDVTVREENPVELIAEAQENARINPRDVTWTFLTTFFTSLIPEIPQN